MIHHETLLDCCSKADCYVEIQYSVGEVAGGYPPLDESGPGNHGKYQPLYWKWGEKMNCESLCVFIYVPT